MLLERTVPHAHKLAPSVPQERDVEVGSVGAGEVEAGGSEI